MISVKQLNACNHRALVVNKYFYIFITEQVEIYFISVVANRHHERSMFIKSLNSLFQRHLP